MAEVQCDLAEVDRDVRDLEAEDRYDLAEEDGCQQEVEDYSSVEEGCFSLEEEGERQELALHREELEEEDRYDLEEVEDETLVRRLLELEEEVQYGLEVEVVCP